MADDEGFDLDASLRHALGPRSLVLDKTPQKPVSSRKAMPGSGRARNPTTPTRTASQVQKREPSLVQTSLSSGVAPSRTKASTSKKVSAVSANDAMSKMAAAVAELRALRSQFPDLPMPDDMEELTGYRVEDSPEDPSAHLFDNNDDLLSPFEEVVMDVAEADDDNYDTHPFVDDEAQESREASPAPLTQKISKHGYQKDDFVVSDDSGDEDMRDVEPPASGVDGTDDMDGHSTHSADIEYADDGVDANEDVESVTDGARLQDVDLSDGEEDVRRFAPRARIHKRCTSEDMDMDTALSPVPEREASVYEEDLPGIPYPSGQQDQDPENASDEDWDSQHAISRSVLVKSSRLYTFYRNHPNKDLQPAHLVTMATVERKYPLLAAVYDNPSFRKSYREEDLIPFLKMLRFQSFGDAAMIGNIDPALFTTEAYTTTATTGRRLVWLENRRNVLNYTLGVCYSSNLRTPIIKTTKKGNQIAQHSLLFGAHDQTHRLMTAVLSKVFAFSGGYSAGSVTYVPEIGNSALAFSTLPSKNGVGPVQWTTESHGSLEASPMSSVKAPVLIRARARWGVDTGVQPYTYPTPIFDGRGDFAGTPEQMNSLISNPPTAKFFGDGNTEIPHNAICLVAHTINSWQNVPEANQTAYPASISLNIQHVVVLALPAVLSGLHVKQPSSQPGIAKSTKSRSLKTEQSPSSSKTIPASSKSVASPKPAALFSKPMSSSNKPVQSSSKPVSSPSKSVSSPSKTMSSPSKPVPSSSKPVPSSSQPASSEKSSPTKSSSEEVLTIRLPAKPSSPVTRQSTKQGRQAVGQSVASTSPVTAGVKRPRASTVATSPKKTRSATAKKGDEV